MPKYEKFEDLPIWQQSRELASNVYKMTQIGAFSRDEGLKSQMQRAAVSIVSNIAEGFERGSDKAFVNFLKIAKASAGELRAQLYIALDLGYISGELHKKLNTDLMNESSQIAGLMRYLQKQETKL